jgi:hypothetical protein
MKQLLLLFCLSSLLAQSQLHNNGPLITGTVAADGFVCPSGYSWSEMQRNTGNTTQANATSGLPAYYYTDNSLSYTLADDFIVPAGQTWSVSSFDFFVYQPVYSGTQPPINSLRIRLYNSNPSVSGSTPIAGDLVTNVYDPANSGNAFMYRIFHATVPTPQQPNFIRKIFRVRGNLNTTLAAGTYWVEFQAHATDNTEVFFPPVTIVGSRSVNGANSKINIITTFWPNEVVGWGNNIDSGSPTSAPDVSLALPFIINGTVLNNEEFNLENQFSVVPNPCNELVYISSKDKSIDDIQIIDLSGRIINSIEINDYQKEINTEFLSSGTYLIKISEGGNSVTKKLIKN